MLKCPDHPDLSQSSELQTVLNQKQDGKKQVTSYASRVLSKVERNYSAFKLEFLAVKWVVAEKSVTIEL